MNIELITAPLIGAAIGTVTNGIAIKMLFRPWKAVYIGKFQVPFTPGLIPKERPRIAKAIAKVIGNNLLDNETMRKTLLSDDMQSRLTGAVTSKIDEFSGNTETVASYLENKGFLNALDEKENSLSSTAGTAIAKKMIEKNISSSLVDMASAEIEKNANPIVAGLAAGVIKSSRDSLILKINGLITEKAPDMISSFMDIEYKKIKDKTVGECTEYLISKFPEYQKTLWNLYTGFIEKYLTSLLNGLNISGIVEQKINEFELPELEKLIMDIARKELNALVALGGLLGFLMGFINVLIS